MGIGGCMPGGMGRLRRWRRDRAGVLGAAVAAAAMLAVTTGVAVLLALRYPRQLWSPVLVTVLGGLPGLYLAGLAAYLAWKALPAVTRRGRGRRAASWDPAVLGVHKVIGGRMPTLCPPSAR